MILDQMFAGLHAGIVSAITMGRGNIGPLKSHLLWVLVLGTANAKRISVDSLQTTGDSMTEMMNDVMLFCGRR